MTKTTIICVLSTSEVLSTPGVTPATFLPLQLPSKSQLSFISPIFPPGNGTDWSEAGTGLSIDDLVDYIACMALPSLISLLCDQKTDVNVADTEIVFGGIQETPSMDRIIGAFKKEYDSVVVVDEKNSRDYTVGVIGAFIYNEDEEGEVSMNNLKLSSSSVRNIFGKRGDDALSVIAAAYGGIMMAPTIPSSIPSTTTATSKTAPSLEYALSVSDSNDTICTFTASPPHLAGPLSLNDVACRGCFFSFKIVDASSGTFETTFNSAKPELTADAIKERLINRMGDPSGFNANECVIS